jgi:anti-sigma factor RsiW
MSSSGAHPVAHSSATSARSASLRRTRRTSRSRTSSLMGRTLAAAIRTGGHRAPLGDVGSATASD